MSTTADGSTRDQSKRFDDVVPHTIDQELELIRTAIAMVASGGAPRVVVASLRFGDQILPRAQVLASASGLVATPQWTLDRNQHSIAIEHKDG